MSLAEQKDELFKFLRAADEKTTAKVIDFVQKLEMEEAEFSNKELAEFKRRSEEHTADPSTGVPWEEAMLRIKNKLRK